MKKLLPLLLLIFSLTTTNAQCHYIVDMQDSYGDGWNGAVINVSVNGVQVASMTVDATAATAATDSISTFTGDSVSFDFVSGTWDTEITFTITAPDGSSVGSYGPYANNSGNDGNIWVGVSNSSCAVPACLDPYGLSASNITSSSVDFSWTAGANASSFNIEYGPTGFNLGNGTSTTSSTSTSTISGLSGYTSYDFYVQSDCQNSSNGLSNLIGPITAITCPGGAPYLENFNTGSAACWTQETADVFDWTMFSGATTSQTTGPSDDVTGGGYYFYIETSVPRAPGDSAIMYSPDIDVSSLSAAELNFYSHMYGASIANLRIDASSDGGVTYSTVFSKSGDQGDQWVEETVNLSAYSSSVSFKIVAYVGDDGNGVQYWGDIAIDNFEIREMPSCPKPTSIVSSNLSATSADFSWTAGGNETSWNVEYGPSGFTLGAGTQATVSTTNYSLTSLTSQTEYDFYVQADCGGGDLSLWQGPSTITTYPGCGDNFGPYCYDVGAYTILTAVVTNPGDMIRLDIIAGQTEIGFDSLQIFDGVGNTGNLLYSADGDHAGGMAISTSGTISLYLKGDASWNCIDGTGGPYTPIEVSITCITPSPVDMELTALTMPTVFGPGNNDITGTVTSYGSNAITSFDIIWDEGNGPNSETFNIPLNFGDTYDFTHSTPIVASNGASYSLTVEVSASNDANANNNTISGTYNSVTQLVPKIVVGEEKTGEWCGWCPRGAVGLVEMAMDYPNDFIGIAVHNGDAMTVSSYDGNIGNYVPGGYPGGGVDRVIDGDPSNFASMMTQRKNGYVPSAGVTATGTYDATTISVDISANFVAGMTGDYRLAAVLIGDSILGAGQANYYDGGGSGAMAMPNYGSMPNLDFTTAGATITPFYHDHVAMALGDDEINGASGTVPSTVSAGDNASHTYTFSRNSNWDVSKMHVVGMLVNGTTGEIMNAELGSLNSNSVGIEKNNTFQTLLYPNPSNGMSTLAIHLNSPSNIDISVINILGEEVYNFQSVLLAAGGHLNKIDLSNNANGIYFIRVNANDKSQTIKLVLKN
jgi:hypothetical protein